MRGLPRLQARAISRISLAQHTRRGRRSIRTSLATPLKSGHLLRLPMARSSAVAAAAFASGFGAIPKITTSKDAVVQMEDTAPAQLSTVGSPNVVSAPLRSVFQTNSIAVRVILNAAWTIRASNAVAWMQSVTW